MTSYAEAANPFYSHCADNCVIRSGATFPVAARSRAIMGVTTDYKYSSLNFILFFFRSFLLCKLFSSLDQHFYLSFHLYILPSFVLSIFLCSVPKFVHSLPSLLFFTSFFLTLYLPYILSSIFLFFSPSYTDKALWPHVINYEIWVLKNRRWATCNASCHLL
jgi:hypothetical protein